MSKVPKTPYDYDTEIHWCPGCGNYSALRILKETLTELNLEQNKVVIVSGIGQAGKFPHFINAPSFNGLHGRYLSNALGIKVSNPELTVIAVSGDGCTYSEGGNHFLHTIRYNPDILNIAHNNQVYGLTKGQASPTSSIGFKTKVQIYGVFNEPFNPTAIAVSLKASFIARAFVGDIEKTKELYKKALNHKGYKFIDLLCPCVTFNKLNTFQWFKEHTYYLDESYDPHDQKQAIEKTLETDKLPLGIIYINPGKPTYEENVKIYREDKTPLYKRELNREKLTQLIDSFR